MSLAKSHHSFHIPVMGTGYTIDSPIRVAHFGISSVISIIDHRLTEQMREYYAGLYDLPFESIPLEEDDSRAKRITGYLNLVNHIVIRNFSQLKSSGFSTGSDLVKYFELLPETSPLKRKYNKLEKLSGQEKIEFQNQLIEEITPGSIDVNIMTKVDTGNLSSEKTPLPHEYNDAHAALRGFANSTLNSSLVLSAGLNPRLYGYMASFQDFFPNAEGTIRKKIILKVSDYRSALIQGKFLAKKGLWVSEFRIESGLNCGGHAFASDGYLMGPILEEFRSKREELKNSLFEIFIQGLVSSGKPLPANAPEMAITAQGGVGTYEEHEFLLTHYQLDSIGWGSPFLLVPEAVNIDQGSMEKVRAAKENDLYLSGVSPLGVPFNTIRDSSAEEEKQNRIHKGKPGAPCFKKHLTFNTEFGKEPLCEASRQFQKKKIDTITKENTDADTKERGIKAVVEKMCLCMGLGNSALLNLGIKMQPGISGVAICPGPNMAYFDKVVSLKVMTAHIYGKMNIIQRQDRPHMFIKELNLYMDYLKNKIREANGYLNEAQKKYFKTFLSNLLDGIKYYYSILPAAALKSFENEIIAISRELFPDPVGVTV